MEKKIRRRLIILAAVIGILLVISMLAPWLVPNDPYATDAASIRMAPCREYPFGTDNLGRCVFSRVLAGARTSILSAVALVSICFAAGTIPGMLCGYYGGILDTIVMRLADVILTVPQLVLAVAVAGILGGGMGNAMLAMGFSGWVLFARLARSEVIQEKEEDYVLAARLGGKKGWQILYAEILPGIAGPLLVNAATQISTMMMGLAGLSFLGLGVQVPEAEWGSMIGEARAYIQLAPWAVLAPAGAVVFTVMLFSYLGDTAGDLLDTGGSL